LFNVAAAAIAEHLEDLEKEGNPWPRLAQQ